MSEDAIGQGLDPVFLGVEVLLPSPVDTALPVVRVDHTHFSILVRTDRRLAAVTGVGVDGAQLRDVGREGSEWAFDPQLPEDQQTGPEVYARNDLDRGHLVRRRDPVWGSREVAEAANAETFYFTNAAPQAAAFNQGEELWLGLEDHLLANAADGRRRLVVLTGPVLAEDDPVYRGTGIPLRFFKVAAFVDAGALAATGYVLDQTPLVDDLDLALAAARAVEDPPPLGPFRTFQVPVTDVAALTGLDLDALAAVDRFPVAAGAREEPARPERGVVPARWRRLTRLEDVVWRADGSA